MEYRDLHESSQYDSSLDLDGKLMNENFGKGVCESYDVNDLCKPLQEK